MQKPGDPVSKQASASAQLADQIARDIRRSKSTPGTVIASQRDLRTRHKAGRSVLRQAVRILEERGIAHMRRGIGGGLVVAKPSAEFAARCLSIALESVSPDLELLSVLPVAIDSHTFLYGAGRLGLEASRELTHLVRRLDKLSSNEFLRVGAHRQLHRAIRTASGEPAVELAYRTVADFGIDLIPYSINVAGEAAKDEAWHLTCEMAAALVAGDAARLFDCRQRQTEMFRTRWRQLEATDRDFALIPKVGDLKRPEFQSASNRAERLAREILREIRQTGWKAGTRIGGGAELVRRYGATTSILRQAVRMLEEHSAVEVEKGRNGGLFVAVPDLRRAVDRADAFLRQSPTQPADVRAFLANLVAETVTSVFPVRVEMDGKDRGARHGVSFAHLCRFVARATKNPICSAFIDILLPFLPQETPSPVMIHTLRKAFADRDPDQRRRLVLFIATHDAKVQAKAQRVSRGIP